MRSTDLLHLLLVDHENVLLQRNDEISVCTELEVISNDVGLVFLDLVFIESSLFDSFEVPCNDELDVAISIMMTVSTRLGRGEKRLCGATHK